MPDTILTTNSLDRNGRQILWSNSITKLYFYDSSSELWDKTGNDSTSWYTEITLPIDSFTGNSLDSERWTFFNYRGTISGTVNNKLRLEIDAKDARGGVSSAGLWSLTGDFDARLYLDEAYYYNEYRSKTATGLTASIDNSNKVRVSKYFDGTSIGYKSHSVESRELKFFGWFDNGALSTSVGETDVTCLRLLREGEVITPYVSTPTGFVQVGNTLSGSVWGGDLAIELEVETEQYNIYKTDVLGFVVSGTLSSPKTFNSVVRGPSKSFPDRSLLVMDSSGLSILDDDSLSLWMRFQQDGENNIFRDATGELSAVNGKVYYTTASGLYVIDFPNDKAYIFVDNYKKTSINSIAGRNFKTAFHNDYTITSLSSNVINDVATKNINGNEFLAIATISGVNLIVNGTDLLLNTEGHANCRTIEISEAGSLYWNTYDTSTGRGDLSYYTNVENLLSNPGPTFSRSGFYDTETSPVALSSEDINSIFVKDSSGTYIVTGHSSGVDFIQGVSGRTSYGPFPIINPVLDPSFESEVGVFWTSLSSTLFQKFEVFKSEAWSSEGSGSLRLGGISEKSTNSGDYGGIYQTISLDNISKLYFDIKLVNDAGLSAWVNYYDLEILVGSQILNVYSDTEESYERFNEFLDVSGFFGLQIVTIRLISKLTGSVNTNKYFYVDNIRVLETTADYSIIPFLSHSVLEVLLLYESGEKKIFFATREGYGAIDLVDNSLDFSVFSVSKIPLSSILSADYSEFIGNLP